MIQLFIRMYGLLIATLAVSFFIQSEVIDYFRKLSTPVNVRERFAGTFYLVEQDLLKFPPPARAARMEEMKAGFGTPITLETNQSIRDRFNLNDESLEALSGIQSLERKEGGGYLAKRLAGSDQIVLIEFPGPKDMRREIYIINWTIEFVMVALLTWFWVRPFWRDLVALREATEKVGEGDLSVRVNIKRSSALYDFAHRFNEMTSRIAQLLKSQKDLTNAISHELRTPLARLRFSQHLAADEPSPEGKDRYLALMDRDINELDELSSELLTYARLESGAPDVVLVKVPAAPWLEDIVDAARRLAAADGRTTVIESDLRVAELVCEPRYMARAVSNLLGNALRFAQARIRVTVEADSQGFRITVDDDGPGITPGERERMFQPFTRLDKSRDRATGGFGMGLAIVRQITVWHGGEARIEDGGLGGARIVLAWPLTTGERTQNSTVRNGSAQTATNEPAVSV